MGSVQLRATAAWLGAWELGISDVAAALQCTSWLELKERWPALANTIAAMDRNHAEYTGQPPHSSRWTQRVKEGAAKRQKELTAPVTEAATQSMLAEMDPLYPQSRTGRYQQRGPRLDALPRGGNPDAGRALPNCYALALQRRRAGSGRIGHLLQREPSHGPGLRSELPW